MSYEPKEYPTQQGIYTPQQGVYTPQPGFYAPQPGMSIPQAQPQAAPTGRGGWRADLFDCFSVPGLCFKTWCCPCITYGETKEKMGSGFGSNCFCYFCAMFIGFDCCLRIMTRGEIRARKGIDGGCLGDCFTHCWCGCCALIQERREFDDQ
ncbi:2721_t:CDS:2 [Paraglomus occultum]|uniref:2721_t:CDS:1 n=1 Tax=Paraglomus occultum TaxID=144539 RepID=A0A9N9GCV6_9GLOM|nr:2721_t:CDS:2 [Paraglomus occultum]